MFRPCRRAAAAALRGHRGLRLLRTGLAMESPLVPSVLEQRGTADSAHYAWWCLLNPYGEQPPGPAPEGMRIPSSAAVWRKVPAWQWHRAGTGRSGAAAILRACSCAPGLEEAAAMALPEAMTRLQLGPGIGPRTAAEHPSSAPSVPLTPSPWAISTCLSGPATPSPVPGEVPTNRCSSSWSRMPVSAAGQPGSSCPAAAGRAARRTAVSLISDTTARRGGRQGAGQTVPRQPPVSAPRDSMNCLKRFRSSAA